MNSRRSGWKLTLPPPHGHSPAMARTSVLLPVPDSPATSTRSPGSITTSVSSTTAVPSSSVTERSSRLSIASPSVSPRLMRPMPSPLLGALQPVERHHQRGDAARAGVPVGEPRIIVDQPAERALHDGEGGRRLHHLSERHAAVEKFRRAQQERHDRREQARALRHQRGAHVLAGQPRPLPQHIGEVPVDAGALLLLAAEQRDALAVLAHARQRVAEFGLGLVLVLGDLHEAAADDHHRARGDRGIDHRGDDEEAGNGDASIPPSVTVSAPPMVHSTTMKVAADRNAEVTPAAKSTGASVATRRSSAMRYSGFLWSPPTRLSW